MYLKSTPPPTLEQTTTLLWGSSFRCNDNVSLAGHLLQLKRLKLSVEIRIFRSVINVFNYKELQ